MIFKNNLPKIFFMHIPKCGGTTVDRAFMTVYKKHACHLDAPASNRALKITGTEKDIHLYRHGLLSYFMSSGQFTYISGHFTFNESIYLEFHDEYQYITFLRDPVVRFISHYFYNKYHNLEDYTINQPLDEFLESPRAEQLGKIYRIFFSSAPSKIDDDASIRDNIMKFDVIACLENIKQFRKQIYEIYGIKLNYKHYMKIPKLKEDQKKELSDNHLKKIKKLCEDDSELYSWILSR
jgi:hypothetical protein